MSSAHMREWTFFSHSTKPRLGEICTLKPPLTKLYIFISSVKLGNRHFFFGNQLFCPSSERRVITRQSCCSISPREQKFQPKPFKNIPEMACFGRIAPVNLLQAGREVGKICWSRLDVGERWSKEKPWKVWVDLEESSFLGRCVEGKATFPWIQLKMKASKASRPGCHLRNSQISPALVDNNPINKPLSFHGKQRKYLEKTHFVLKDFNFPAWAAPRKSFFSPFFLDFCSSTTL